MPGQWSVRNGNQALGVDGVERDAGAREGVKKSKQLTQSR
jgi:hypothetical protein